jgi:hypothetical protein
MTYAVTNNTEAALAEAFAEKHRDSIRYVAETKRWFIKNASGWEPDTKLQVLYSVQATCMEAAARSGDPTLAKSLCSAATISAVERLARCHPMLAATKADVGLPPPKKRKPEVSVE